MEDPARRLRFLQRTRARRLSFQDLPYVIMVALMASLVAAIPFALSDTARGVRRERLHRALAAGGVVGSIAAYHPATLSPFGMIGDAQGPGAPGFPQNLNLVPIIDMLSTRMELLLVNLALLAPFGFLLHVRWRSLGLRHVALISLIAAAVIEGVQLSHPMRGSIDDVVLKVAGAVPAAWAAASPLKRYEIDPEPLRRLR